jgi:chemotaxis protein methyltransferase CheR
MEDRLERLARSEQLLGLQGLLAAARAKDGELRQRICEAVTVHETRFFRDERMFTALRTHVIPALLATGRRSLSVWCAASASGQEPLSMAILLREHFPGVPAKIVATDLSRAMVARTDRAIYTEFEASRGLSLEQRARHFVPVAGGLEARPELRAMIDARTQNLAAPWPSTPPFDLILVRNVLVYLDPTVRTDVIARARTMLASDGVLVLGATEGWPGDDLLFRRFTANDAVFYRPTQEAR